MTTESKLERIQALRAPSLWYDPRGKKIDSILSSIATELTDLTDSTLFLFFNNEGAESIHKNIKSVKEHAVLLIQKCELLNRLCKGED